VSQAHEQPSPAEVARVASEVGARAEALRGLGAERRAAAIARAAAVLASPRTALGQRARASLPGATGLSPAMVAWALESSLAPVSQRALMDLMDAALAPATRAITTGAPAAPGATGAPDSMTARPVVPGLVAVILAGNVFTAGLRPVILPLCLGAPVVCKTSSREQVFPALLREALLHADAALGPALGVLCFGGGERDHERALLERADVVIVYGGDATVQEVRGRTPATARVIEHGHGTSAAYVGASALASEERARRAATALALDTAAYDQRGCLSPLVAWVRSGQAVDPRRFATLVHQALDALDRDLPRGPLDPVLGAAQMQWRGVAAVQGELFEGRGHAVAYSETPRGAPGPGWRNLLVRPCQGPAELTAELAGDRSLWGAHLKALGVACDQRELGELIRLLALCPRLCPRLCPLGRMQSPPFDAFAEGRTPLAGLVSWLSVEAGEIAGAEPAEPVT
jgi:hypothetical protein